MALTNEEIKDIAAQVKALLLTDSISLNELTAVNTIEGLIYLMALKREGTLDQAVSIPAALLTAEMRVTNTHLQYRVGGHDWQDLIEFEKIKGQTGDSAFQLWQKETGNADKTYEDYLAYLKKPATDAASELTQNAEKLRASLSEEMSQVSQSAKQTLDAAKKKVDDILADGGMYHIVSSSESEVGKLQWGGKEYTIYEQTIEISGLPKNSGTSADVVLSDTPIGGNLYLSAGNLIVSDKKGAYYPSVYSITKIYESEQFETRMIIECKENADIELSAMVTLNFIKYQGDIIEFKVQLPAGQSTENVALTVAPLKYNKKFAFTYTADDSVVGAWARVFNRINKKWIDDVEFFHKGATRTTGHIPTSALTMTDGCGNLRRFGFSCALWPTQGNDYSPNGFISESSQSKTNPYITWEELREMVDFGVSVCEHNVDERKYSKSDPAQIVQGFIEDSNKTYTKLGRYLKILCLPDGNKAYIDAMKLSDVIDFARSSVTSNQVYLNDVKTLYKVECKGGVASADDTAAKLNELAAQRISDNPLWSTYTSHRVSLEVLNMLGTIYDLYGSKGDDSIWVASWDEIYEYVVMRESLSVSKTIDGQTISFKIKIPFAANFYFRDLSFLIKGLDGDTIAVPVSSPINGFSYKQTSDTMLVNVNFDANLLVLSEKYTAKYEKSLSEEDKEDGLYFVNQLMDGKKKPFMDRLTAGEIAPELNSITINAGLPSTYNKNVEVVLSITGMMSHYKISESLSLSGAEWIESTSNTLSYTLSSALGEKNVYVQVKNQYGESEIKSASITLQEKPAVLYTVTGQSYNTNYGTVTPATQEVGPGGTANLSAAAKSGYVIGSWSGATTSTGVGEASGTATVTNIQENKTVVCNFKSEQSTGTGDVSIISFGYDYSEPNLANNSSKYDGDLKITKVRYGSDGNNNYNIYNRTGSIIGTFQMAGFKIGTAIFQGNVTGDNSGVYPDEVLKRNIFRATTLADFSHLDFSLPSGKYKISLFINTKQTIPLGPEDVVYEIESSGVTQRFETKSSYVDNFNDLSSITIDIVDKAVFKLWGVNPKSLTPMLNAIEIEKIS